METSLPQVILIYRFFQRVVLNFLLVIVIWNRPRVLDVR